METLPVEELLKVRELASRQNDGLTVTLWWVHGTMDTYVTLEDFRGVEHGEEPARYSIDVPEDVKANEVFEHPFSYLGVDDGRGNE